MYGTVDVMCGILVLLYEWYVLLWMSFLCKIRFYMMTCLFDPKKSSCHCDGKLMGFNK